MRIILFFLSPMPITFSVKLKTEILLENNYEMEYWNMSGLFFSHKELIKYFSGNSKYRANFNNEKIIKNKKQLIYELKKLKNNTHKYLFWCYDLNNQNDFWIRRLFKIYNISYFVGPKRTPYVNYLIKSKKFKRYTFKRVINAIRRRLDINYIKKNLNLLIFKKTNYYQHPLFVMGSGKLGRQINNNFFPKSMFLHVPSFDVDWSNLSENNKELCVYVDDAIDFGTSRNTTQRENAFFSCTDINKFYSNLRIFFDKIEKIYKKKIVIAAKGIYFHNNQEKFGNREIFYNQTNNLIKKSKIVIGHESSGLWQSIISGKKMMILDDPTLTNQKKNAIKNMSIFLDLPILDLSTISEKTITEYFNSYNKNYEHLINEYFSINQESKEYKNILLDNLNNIRKNLLSN